DNDVRLVKPVKVGRGLEPVFAHQANCCVGNVPDVAFAPGEFLDLRGINVEADDRDTAVAPGPSQGQADIAQADYAHAKCAGFDFGAQGVYQTATTTGLALALTEFLFLRVGVKCHWLNQPLATPRGIRDKKPSKSGDSPARLIRIDGVAC